MSWSESWFKFWPFGISCDPKSCFWFSSSLINLHVNKDIFMLVYLENGIYVPAKLRKTLTIDDVIVAQIAMCLITGAAVGWLDNRLSDYSCLVSVDWSQVEEVITERECVVIRFCSPLQVLCAEPFPSLYAWRGQVKKSVGEFTGSIQPSVGSPVTAVE